MLLNKLPLYICTSFGIGYLTSFPGTISSFLILPIVWFLKSFFGLKLFFCFEIFFIIFSFLMISQTIKNLKNKDPKFIVIDEYIGQSIALMFCDEEILQYAIAFLLFRFFDILKPYPVSFFDEKKNTFGVIMDDVVAGLISGLIIYFCFQWIL